MELFSRQVWINFLGLLPGSLVTVLAIAVAFLRFYGEQDFQFLSIVAQPQTWSNRLTVAALLAALALPGRCLNLRYKRLVFLKRPGQTDTFGVEWNRRNREGNREAEAGEREAKGAERETRRDRQEARRNRQEVRYQKAQIRHQLDPDEANRQELESVLAALDEYEQTLDEALSS